MNFAHRVKHKLKDIGQASIHTLMMPQRYLVQADLVASDPQAQSEASSELKIGLFDQANIKKALYSSVKASQQDAQGQICLLEVELVEDVFTATMVLLNKADDTDAEKLLKDGMRSAMTKSLKANIKFKLAFENWAPQGNIHQEKVAEFVSRAAEEFVVKTVPSEKLLASPADEQGYLGQSQLNAMIKHSVLRHYESTDNWVICSSSRGKFLVQKALLTRPKDRHTQNLLKIEIGVSSASLQTSADAGLTMEYKLYLTVRLSKVQYVDCANFNKIGEQQFYVLPNFERACLSEIYESQARACNQAQAATVRSAESPELTHVKVKYIKSDLEEVVEPGQLVWCPAPYELPCQSLFFALLKYRQVAKELDWVNSEVESDFEADLESFRFVHLDNIKRQMESGDSGPAPPSVFQRIQEHAMEVDDDFGFRKSGAAYQSKDQMVNPEEGQEHDEYAPTPTKASAGKTKSSGRRSAKSTVVDEEDLGVWGDLNRPFVGFKMASMTLRKIQKYSPQKLEQPEADVTMADGSKPKWLDSEQQAEVVNEEDPAIAISEEQKAHKKAVRDSLSELKELLDFVDVYSDAAAFFDQNGSRQIYTKFRDESSRERILHNIVHFFISLHLPGPAVGSCQSNHQTGVDPAAKKSNLKKSIQGMDYQRRIAETSALVSKANQAKNLRTRQSTTTLLTSANGDDRPRTKDELAKLFAWWQNEMRTDQEPESPKATIEDQKLLKMAFGDKNPQKETNSAFQKTARGFLKTLSKANVKGKPLVKASEYTFFKKKVRLNVVEKKVHTFNLDEEEINQKKAKKKPSTRKNF